MDRTSDIPPPVVEANKDEYLEELDNIKQAEVWIKKHSNSTNKSQQGEIISGHQMLDVKQEDGQNMIPLIPSSTKNSDSFFVLIILLFMGFLGLFVLYGEQRDGEVIVALCELFSICVIMFTPMGFWRQKKEKQNNILVKQESKQKEFNRDELEHTIISQEQGDKIIIQDEDYLWDRAFTKFGIGFSIPVLFWLFMFGALGEPCVVFCTGREAWNIYLVLIGNVSCCFILLLGAIFDRRFIPWIFLFGFFIGSIIGLNAGGIFFGGQ